LATTNTINSLITSNSNHTPHHHSLSATSSSDSSITEEKDNRPFAICVRNLPLRSTG